MTHSSLYGEPTIAEKEVPDSEQCVEGQVTCEQTHQPVSGEHEGLHPVVLQVFVGSWTRPFQSPVQHGRIEQDSLLQRHTCLDGSGDLSQVSFFIDYINRVLIIGI